MRSVAVIIHRVAVVVVKIKAMNVVDDRYNNIAAAARDVPRLRRVDIGRLVATAGRRAVQSVLVRKLRIVSRPQSNWNGLEMVLSGDGIRGRSA